MSVQCLYVCTNELRHLQEVCHLNKQSGLRLRTVDQACRQTRSKLLQVVMAGVRQPVCKLELDNLVEIKVDVDHQLSEDQQKKLVLREALVEWTEQVQQLEAKVEKRTDRKNQLTNELYQLVGLYSVFVGVVFTAVLQSSRVECQHIGSPIVLCLFAYFAALFAINKKSKKIEEDRITIDADDYFRKVT